MQALFFQNHERRALSKPKVQDQAALQRFLLFFLKHISFFIAAISLLFKSTDNVFLSILLYPFQWRVQGFSLSGSIWGGTLSMVLS